MLSCACNKGGPFAITLCHCFVRAMVYLNLWLTKSFQHVIRMDDGRRGVGKSLIEFYIFYPGNSPDGEGSASQEILLAACVFVLR